MENKKSELFLYISTIASEKESHRKLYRAAEHYYEYCLDVDSQTVECAGESDQVKMADNAVSFWHLEKAEHGKPYFAEAPWLHFSISHSGNLWACVIADQPVGMDLQLRRKKSGEKSVQHSARIAERFFHPDEKAFIKNGGDFYDVWAAKESYVKYTGRGIGEGFDAFAVADENGILPRVKLEKKETAELKLLYPDKLADYSLCICAQEIKDIGVIWI